MDKTKLIELSDTDDDFDLYMNNYNDAADDPENRDQKRKTSRTNGLLFLSEPRNENENENENGDEDKNNRGEKDDSENRKKFIDITLIENVPDTDDEEILNFMKFCIKHRFFDDTFYDYGNILSIVATKLPDTFNKLGKGKEKVTKYDFVYLFKKKYKYKGDIEYIFNYIDEEEHGFITWDEFKNFFLPFVRNITV